MGLLILVLYWRNRFFACVLLTSEYTTAHTHEDEFREKQKKFHLILKETETYTNN